MFQSSPGRSLSIVFFLFLLSLSERALARRIDVKSAGDACPPNSVNVVMSPDGESMSVLFDSFQAEAGGSTGKATARVNCTATISIDPPKGTGLGVYKIDYRGFQSLPLRSLGELNVDYDIGTIKIPGFRRLFTGALKDGDYLVTDNIPQVRFLGCDGASVNLVLRATLSVTTNPKKEQAIVFLDTVDGAPKGGVTYHLQYRKCK